MYHIEIDGEEFYYNPIDSSITHTDGRAFASNVKLGKGEVVNGRFNGSIGENSPEIGLYILAYSTLHEQELPKVHGPITLAFRLGIPADNTQP